MEEQTLTTQTLTPVAVKKRNYRKKDDLKRFFYPREYLNCLNKINNDKHKFWIELLVHTGARINEARGIQIRDIDLEKETINLRQTKGRKVKKNRMIQISSYLKGRIEIYIKNNNLGAYDFLMQNPDENNKTPSTVGMDKIVKKFARDGGIKDWVDFSCHNLRKTLEQWGVALNINVLTLQAHMGHTIDVASTHYVGMNLMTSEDKSLAKAIIDNLWQK